MGITLRIAVADANFSHRTFIAHLIRQSGHQALEFQSVDELTAGFATVRFDMAIVDLDTPRLDGIETAEWLWERFSVPTILVSDDVDENVIDRAANAHISALMVKPIRKPDLLASVAVAHRVSTELRSLRDTASTATQALADRKIVDRAKGIIMRKQGIDEAAAFKLLHTIARKSRQKVVEVANSVVIADQAFSPPTE